MSTANQALTRAFIENHPDRTAAVVERFPPGEVARFLGSEDPETAAPVVAHLTSPMAAALLEKMEPAEAASIVSYLPSHNAAAVLRALLEQEAGTVGALMEPRILSLDRDVQATEALAAARHGDHELPSYVFVVQRPGRFEGVLGISQVLRARPGQSLGQLGGMRREAVSAGEPAANIATHPAWATARALPVVDREGNLVGAVTFESIYELLASRPSAVREGVSTAVSLSQLYWFGLTGLVDGLARMSLPADRRSGRDHDD